MRGEERFRGFLVPSVIKTLKPGTFSRAFLLSAYPIALMLHYVIMSVLQQGSKMKSIFLVWVLITSGGYNGNQLSYSPPVADLASCQRMQEMAKDSGARSRCIQIEIVK